MGELTQSPSPRSPLPLRLLTHNIRYATTSPFPGELPWSSRLPRLLSQLHFHTRLPFSPASTLLCLQEVLHHQLLDLLAGLGPEWSFVGVGRNDGTTQGEFAPILYRAKTWRVVHWETVWLNEDGRVGAKGWDAASVRILEGVVLEFTGSEGYGKRVLALNTHLDDQGVVSRRESAKVILRVAERLKGEYLDEARGDFWFLAGDLNSTVSGDAYVILSRRESGLRDSLLCVAGEWKKQYGNFSTFTGFDGNGDGEGLQRIDFVFASVCEDEAEGEGDVVRGYSVLPNSFEDGIYISDHRAVIADMMV